MALAPRRDTARPRAAVSGGGFRALDDVVLGARGFEEAGLPDERLGPLQLASAWRRAVGGPLSRASRPGSLSDGRLRVDVKDAGWKRELERLEPLIRGRLTRQIPSRAVHAIDFHVDRSKFRPGSAPRRGVARAADLFVEGRGDLSGQFQQVMDRYLGDRP